MKNASELLSVDKQSTECLVQESKNSTGSEKFRSQSMKRGATTEPHTVQVSTITKASTAATVSPKKSCCRKYFCYFCYKCKLKKAGRGTISALDSSSRKRFSCSGCKNSFKSLSDTLRCRKKKMRTTLADAKAAADSSTPTPAECGGCVRCKKGVYKCLGVLCCWNSVICLKVRSKCDRMYSCCRKCLRCSVKKQTVITESERRRSTISTAAHKPRKWTRVFTDFPKLDSSFVDHVSVMRGAIPVLPLPLAWICLIMNVFLPGFGTFSSGVFCLFVGKPRFSINDSLPSRFGSFLVNLLVAGSQLFTVLFCLVGWGWSIWWGVIMLRMAKKNKRIMLAEQAANEPRSISVANQNRDVERGGTM